MTNRRIEQPVVFSIQRLSARAGNTMVRWAWMESHGWWQTGYADFRVMPMRSRGGCPGLEIYEARPASRRGRDRPGPRWGPAQTAHGEAASTSPMACRAPFASAGLVSLKYRK